MWAKGPARTPHGWSAIAQPGVKPDVSVGVSAISRPSCGAVSGVSREHRAGRCQRRQDRRPPRSKSSGSQACSAPTSSSRPEFRIVRRASRAMANALDSPSRSMLELPRGPLSFYCYLSLSIAFALGRLGRAFRGVSHLAAPGDNTPAFAVRQHGHGNGPPWTSRISGLMPPRSRSHGRLFSGRMGHLGKPPRHIEKSREFVCHQG